MPLMRLFLSPAFGCRRRRFLSTAASTLLDSLPETTEAAEHVSSGRYAAALPLLQRVVDIVQVSPEHAVEAMQRVVGLSCLLSEFDTGERALSELASLRPCAALSLARLHLQRGRFEQAVELAKGLRRVDTSPVAVVRSMYVTAIGSALLGEHAESAEVLRTAATIDKGLEFETLLVTGCTLHIQGDLSGALAAWGGAATLEAESSVASSAKRSRVHSTLGFGLLESRDRIEEASNAFHRALELITAVEDPDERAGGHGGVVELVDAALATAELEIAKGRALNGMAVVLRRTEQIVTSEGLFRSSTKLLSEGLATRNQPVQWLALASNTEDYADLLACWERRENDAERMRALAQEHRDRAVETFKGSLTDTTSSLTSALLVCGERWDDGLNVQ